MPSDADRYEAYYSEKLWSLLPEVYRALDADVSDSEGPLRAICHRIGIQAAILRRSIDRAWEDQSIETCDDWVIPYIGDLLATRLVSSLDARGQRLDVARTIHYRRRAGTRAVLEQIGKDITGWDVRVVELFRRMARARHGLDPEIGWPEDTADPAGARRLQRAEGLTGLRSGTPMGGTADLRNCHGASLRGTPFDEYFYTADVRRGRERTGWYNISRLAVFTYRLQSVPVDRVTPVQDASCPNQYTFDPSGRDIPLFAASSRAYGDDWTSPAEQQVPGPIGQHLLQAELSALYAAMVSPGVLEPRSLRIYEDGDGFTFVPPSDVTADPRDDSKRFFIAPERGRLYVLSGGPVALHTGYHHGFSSTIGAGAYDRRTPGEAPTPAAATTISVSGGGGFGAALTTLGSTPGEVQIKDSLTYTTTADITVSSLRLRADNKTRPLVRVPAPATWTFTGTGGSLWIEGIWVCGTDLVIAGDFDSVTITCCTIDPGDVKADGSGYVRAADGQTLWPCRLQVTGNVGKLTIRRSILGPISTVDGGSIEDLSIADSIVQGSYLADGIENALSIGTGRTSLSRVTVLGPLAVHRLEASDSILHDVATVTDLQHGCVRYSACSKGSALPRRYQSVQVAARAPLFVSRRFGEPGYAQLLDSAGRTIAEGAEGGSEMGAFCRENAAIKERSLLLKLQEYMPVGLAPVVVHVT